MRSGGHDLPGRVCVNRSNNQTHYGGGGAMMMMSILFIFVMPRLHLFSDLIQLTLSVAVIGQVRMNYS